MTLRPETYSIPQPETVTTSEMSATFIEQVELFVVLMNKQVSRQHTMWHSGRRFEIYASGFLFPRFLPSFYTL